MSNYANRASRAVFSLAIILTGLVLSSHQVEAEEAGKNAKPQPPIAGEPAPDFTLSVLGEDKTVTLGDFKGKQDVVLVFGSYT